MKAKLINKALAWLMTLTMVVSMLPASVFAAGGNVAKVGDTEYATIDEAVANWTNGTTLTLLADVTLSDVIKLNSTEHHILDLGTYTMTAASGKHAIEITCEGCTSASYALTVNADENEPGGITASGKACIYYSKSDSTKDRPIIRIYNGVFDGSYSINSKSNGNTNCPQIWIYGGTFNGNVNLTKNMLRVFGGTFNGWINCTGDSSAYREISGGRFKSWQFMTADADSKFWVGTSKANYDVGCYVDDEGYLVVGGPAVTEAGETFEASSANYGGWSSYLKYSSAKDNGLYYTSVEEAFADNNKTTGSVTVYVDELDMTGINFKGTIVAPEGKTLTITNAPDGLKTEGNVVVVRPAVKIGTQGYDTLAEALAAAKTMTGDVTVEIFDKVTMNANLTGSFDSITFVGKEADAEIYMDIQGAIYASGKKVAFQDLKLSKVAGGYVADAGFRNLAFGLYAADEVTYTNCTFLNGAYASGKDTFTGCTFYRSHDRYGLWAYGAEEVLVDGCTFADFRGIKLFSEGNLCIGDLTVKNTYFTAVNDKPAIVLTDGKSVTLSGNTYSATGVFELDLDGKPDGTAVTSDVAPTCINDNGTCGVLVDGKIYTTAAQANEVAVAGSEVTLLHDSAETVEFAEGVELDKNGFTAAGVTVKQSAPAYVAEINGVGYESLAEAIKATKAGETVTLLSDATLSATTNIDKSITIDGDGHTLTQAADFAANAANVVLDIFGNATVTFENLTFDGIKTVGIMRTVNANIVMDNCTVQNCKQTVSQGMLRLACGNATITNSKFLNNDCTMVVSFGYDAANDTDVLLIDGCTFEGNTCGETAVVYFADGDYATVSNTKFVDNEVTSTGNAATLYMGWGSGFEVSGCLFEGNSVTTSHATTKRFASAIFCDGCAVTGNAFIDNTATRNGETIATTVAVGAYYGPADVSGNYWGGAEPSYSVEYTVEYTRNEVAFEDYYTTYEDGVLGSLIEVKAAVAKIGDVEYATLGEAMGDVEDGQTITLLADVAIDTETYTISDGVSVTLDMNGKKLSVTDNATANYELFYIYGELTVTGNGTIELTSTNDRDWSAMSAIFHNRGGVLTIENGTFQNLGGTDMAWVVDNSGNHFGDAVTNIEGGVLTSTYTAIRNRMEQNTHGASGTAILNIDGGTVDGTTSAIWAQAASTSEVSPATGEINVTGGEVGLINTARSAGAKCMTTVTGGTVATFKGEVGELTVKGGTVTDVTILTSDGQPADYTITDEGLYAPITYVAKIGDKGYATLSEAFAAVTGDNDTVTILCDVTENLAGAYIRGNLVAEADVTITLTNTDWVYLPYTFVVGENVTLKAPALFYYAGGAQINGTVIADAYYQRYAGTKLTINEPGSLTVTSEQFYLRYTDGDPNAGIYVVGDNNDETIGLNTSVIYFYQGMINAKDANIKTAVYWQTNETDGQGSANLVLDNTKMDVTVNESNFKATGNSTATLKNGSVLTCAGGFEAAENGVSVQDTSKIVYNGGIITAPAGLVGAGTEANPYLIKSIEDLILFRDSVNAGETKYNAEGVYVALDADIDMVGINWIGIGSIAQTHGFMGNFDGKGFKVKNLTITDPALDSDGYAYASLFSITEGTDKDNQNVIKNLTIENVTISTTGHIVSAAIAYPYYTIVDNVTVCGDINIIGGNYTAGALAYTRRCVNASNVTVSGSVGSAITGAQVVGGVISDIQMNGGLTAAYSNFHAEGLTINGTKNVGGISGIIASQTLDGATVKNVVINGADTRVGIVSGVLGGVSTIKNVVSENVTGATAIIGGTYDAGAAVEAKIGNTYYATLDDALVAAQTGETIELLAPIVVAAGESLTLDKAVTITYTSNVPGEDMITNRGTLVIDGATLVYTNNDTTGSNVTVSTISSAPGSVLTVNSGVVKNDSANNSKGGAGSFAYAIDLLTNGGLGDVTATINGGEVISTNYMAIRQFVNGETCKNTLTVNGGIIQGATRGINIQLQNNMAYTTINGGTIEGGDYALCFLTTSENLSVMGGEFKGEVWYSGTDGFITGGTFDSDVTDYCAEGYTCMQNADGTYGIMETATELFTLAGITTSLDSSLALNIYYTPLSGATATDYYAVVAHQKEDTVEETTIPYADWGTSGSKKLIRYAGLAAKEMADELTVTIYDADGTAVSKSFTTSFRAYAIGMMSSGQYDPIKHRAWFTALTDMLNYGAAAQQMFGYKTDNLANAGTDAFQQYASTEYTLSTDGFSMSGTAWAPSLTLESTILLNFYFNDVTEGMYATYSYTTHAGTPVSATVDYGSFVSGWGHYGVAVPIAIADAGTPVTVTMFHADGSVAGTMTCSANNYLKGMAENNPDAALYPALAKFATSAKEAFAN